MNDYVTKKELEEVLDKRFAENNTILLEAMNAGFERMNGKFESIDRRFEEHNKKFDTVFTQLDGIAGWMKNMSDEFTIMKSEQKNVRTILKQKFNIDPSPLTFG